MPINTLGQPDFLLIASAAAFATEAHKNQRRKELGEPYIVHPTRVAHRAAIVGFDPEFIAACWLHDVIEDCGVTENTLRNAFPTRTVDLVVAMTKWWDEGVQKLSDDVKAANYKAYYQRLLDTEDGVNIKGIDRADNLFDFAKMARMSQKAHKWASNYHRKTGIQFSAFFAQAETAGSPVHPDVLAYYTVALHTLGMEVRDVK